MTSEVPSIAIIMESRESHGFTSYSKCSERTQLFFRLSGGYQSMAELHGCLARPAEGGNDTVILSFRLSRTTPTLKY